MHLHKKLKWLLVFFLIVTACSFLLNIVVQTPSTMHLKANITNEFTDDFQLYLLDSADDELSEENSVKANYATPNVTQELKFKMDTNVFKVRFDLGAQPSKPTLSDIKLTSIYQDYDLPLSNITMKNSNQVSDIKFNETSVSFQTDGTDPYVYVSIPNSIKNDVLRDNAYIKYFLVIGISLIVSIVMCLLLKIRKDIIHLIREMVEHRELIYRLSLNDFKTRYAGSYLGVVWAFVQPVITVLIYWFVFEVGFRSGPVQEVPFILWLVAGIVPWFFFAESLGNSTNSLIEYNYLVKKVVFQIRVLPFMKIISSSYVHIFFILITLLIYGVYGLYPDIYYIQLIYYSIAAFVMVYSISLITSSLIVFFKDLGQIVSLVLQFGMWLTPILWNSTMLPSQFRWILKINPAYYVVEGYRDSLIYKVWFWERYNQSIYFWLLTAVFFVLGIVIMKKLKPHFADVL
ncbi:MULTISPECIES: ABC transporter permease [Paenibacillus]|uniref:ABC transporter permease n=1 Tax=Paenibacillus TaxID=44249 RepID=UPI00040E3DCE|nr:ABC transporter permease [Paenibacillus massiliensis]